MVATWSRKQRNRKALFKNPRFTRGFLLAFCDVFSIGFFGFGGWYFLEVAAIDFAVVHKVTAIFFDEDADAASDWDGYNGADETKSVDADSDSRKDDEGGQIHAFALYLWRNYVGFNLKIDNGVDDKSDAGTKLAETEQEGDECAADERAEHWDKAEDASNETEWEREAWVKAEDETHDKDYDHGGASVDEADGNGARDISADSLRETMNDVLGFFGGAAFKIVPKHFGNFRSLGKHEEGKYES